MTGFYFIIPTLFVVFISFLVVRAGAIALMMTGLDKKRAHFQSLSAFTGTGFTTKEAETVVNNPKRRKIVTWLMILGNAGIVSVIVTATTSVATSRGFQIPITVVILIIGIYIVYRIATSKGFIRRWESLIEDRLIKTPAFEEAPTENLLHMLEGYTLVRAIIQEDSDFIDKTLTQCKLTQKGVLVLGIERGKKWIPIPPAKTTLEEHDKLVVYGPRKQLTTVFKKM